MEKLPQEGWSSPVTPVRNNTEKILASEKRGVTSGSRILKRKPDLEHAKHIKQDLSNEAEKVPRLSDQIFIHCRDCPTQ